MSKPTLTNEVFIRPRVQVDLEELEKVIMERYSLKNEVERLKRENEKLKGDVEAWNRAYHEKGKP